VLTMLTCALCRQGDVWFLFDQFMYLLLGINYKTTTLLLDGKRIKLQLWYVLEIDTLSLLISVLLDHVQYENVSLVALQCW